MSGIKTCGSCENYATTHCDQMRKGEPYLIKPTDTLYAENCPGWKAKKGAKAKFRKAASGRLGGLAFEAVEDAGKPRFLVRDLDAGTWAVAASLNADGYELLPIMREECPYPAYNVFEGPVDASSLYREVYGEVDRFLDVEKSHRHLIATAVFLTYQQHKTITCPYLYFVGDNESGKTQALRLLSLLCYRPLFGTSIPAADLYTYLEAETAGTILEDEIQGVERDPEKLKIYKDGYKQGARIPRIVTSPRTGARRIRYYSCFCFKACAGERLISSRGFMERFIVVQMVEGSPASDEFTQRDMERLQTLRSRLLKWRLAVFNQPLPDAPHLPVKGRMKEIWKPLIQTAHALPSHQVLLSRLEEVERERRREREDSLEGKLTRAVLTLIGSGEDPGAVPFQKIWEAFRVEVDGEVDLRAPHKMQTCDFGEVSKSLLGHRLREILGARRATVRLEGYANPQRVHVFDIEKLERAARKYCCRLVTDVTDVTDLPGVHVEIKGGKKADFGKKALKKAEKIEPPPSNIGYIGNSVTTFVSDIGSTNRADPPLEKENLGSCAVCGRPFHLGDGIYPHPPWLYCEACHRRTFQPERGGDAP